MNPLYSPGMTYGHSLASFAARETVGALERGDFSEASFATFDENARGLYSALATECEFFYRSFRHPDAFERAFMFRPAFFISLGPREDPAVRRRHGDAAHVPAAPHGPARRADHEPALPRSLRQVNDAARDLEDRGADPAETGKAVQSILGPVFEEIVGTDGVASLGLGQAFVNYDDRLERVPRKEGYESLTPTWHCPRCANRTPVEFAECYVCGDPAPEGTHRPPPAFARPPGPPGAGPPGVGPPGAGSRTARRRPAGRFQPSGPDVNLRVLAIVPVVAATAAAGIIAAPSKERPCVVTYSEGFSGGRLDVDLGPDGNLWATEGQADKIARFDLDTKTATEFDLPGTEPHDLVVGPDDDLWFSSFNGGLGKFDPETEKVEVYRHKSDGSQPHIWWAKDGRAYYSDLLKGRLVTFDPETERFSESSYNLPAKNGLHGFIEMKDGNAWWGLQNVDQIAHFDLETGRFDKFVDMPRDSGPHWLVRPLGHRDLDRAAVRERAARYDLETGEVKTFDLGLDAVTAKELQDRKPVPAIAQVHKDAQDEALWVTTLAGGEIRRFDLETHEVERLGCGLSFPSQTTTLTNDSDGNLWMTESPAAASGAGRLGRIDR